MKGKKGKRGLSRLVSFLVFFLVFYTMMPPAFAAGKGERSFIVDSVVGNVFVQKAGSAKEVPVYAGTVIQEGDRLRTEEGSSATLSSTDREDSLVLSENTELYAEVLAENSGAKQTRLRVQAGSVYAEVEPLTESRDTFELVNPEAVISARGTHFSVSVDPLTGLPSTYVYSGVVTAESSRQPDSPPARALPGQQIDLDPSASEETPAGVVSPIDMKELAGQVDEEMLRQLLANKEDIERENEERKQDIIDGYTAQDFLAKNGNEPAPDDMNKLTNNLNNLVGNIVKGAVENGAVNQERAQQIVDELNSRTPADSRLDLGTIPPIESLSGEAASQSIENRERLAQQKSQQQQQKEQMRDSLEQTNKALIERVQEMVRQQQEANQRALEEQQQKAEERYLQQLPESDQQRFEEAQQQRTQERQLAQQEREQRQPLAPQAPQTPAPPSSPSLPSPPSSSPSSPPSGGSSEGGSSPSPTIVGVIQPEPIKIAAGADFTLPAKVNVRMSDNTTRLAEVQWQDEFDPSEYGQYTIGGTVAGYEGEVTLEVMVYVPYGEPFELNPAKRMIPLPEAVIRFIDASIPDGGSNPIVSPFEFTKEESEVTGLVPAGAVLELKRFEAAGGDIELQFDLEDGAIGEEMNEGNIGIFYQQDNGVWNYLPTTIENGKASAKVESINGIYGVFYAEHAEFPDIPNAEGNEPIEENL
ncbi:FecR domain-containing protein [Paenibacillus physcomitrellae]|uniref:FecR protein domain-containing protein n=1 Tax=Paenibacillus physcomitrellae TaxID=1619311 RepID=A0ABQ1FT11_9BACL|nr:FecR domain-containing protein [Paenibacillus physcomitrellae]GGA29057.1 hypothetical protein GCM10010917_12510 [Paenibacillus physcomitrellae]